MVNEFEGQGSGQKKLSGSRLLAEIGRRCAGLVYMSETDAEVVPFAGGKVEHVGPVELLRTLGLPPETDVETADFDEFFERLARTADWHTEADSRRALGFRRLADLLYENLGDRAVFRIGEIRVEIFAVGRDRGGRLAGIRTKAVET